MKKTRESIRLFNTAVLPGKILNVIARVIPKAAPTSSPSGIVKRSAETYVEKSHQARYLTALINPYIIPKRPPAVKPVSHVTFLSAVEASRSSPVMHLHVFAQNKSVLLSNVCPLIT